MVKAEDLVAGFQQSLAEEWGYIWGKTHEMWSDAKQAAYVRDYAGDEKRKLSCEYGGKWAGHWVTDCSGLVKYWVEKLGGSMYHGSNTMYLKWCTSKGELKNGRRTDGLPLKPGTAVFCYNGTKYSHVGLYVGDGWVIEAAGSKQGVIRSKVTDSKWDAWGELKGVDYSGSSGNSPAPDPAPQRPTIRRGSRGDAVRDLQERLISLGYDVGASGIDGIFGQATEAAVRAYQAASGLAVDGIVGPRTWAALEANPTEKTYTVIISGVSKNTAMELLRLHPTADIKEEG